MRADCKKERNWFIFTNYKGRGGPTLKNLGDMFGIGAERVRGIIARQERFYLAAFAKPISYEVWTPEKQYQEFQRIKGEGDE